MSTNGINLYVWPRDQVVGYMTKTVLSGVIKMVKENARPHAPGEKSYLTREYGELNDENRIGAGSFGVVYRVKRGDKGVAVKVVSPWEFGPNSKASSSTKKCSVLTDFLQTLQEAVLQSEVLDHDNVVKVHDKWIQYETSQSDLTPDKMADIAECANVGQPDLMQKLLEASNAIGEVKFFLSMDLYDGNLEKWLQDGEELKRDATVGKISVDIMKAVEHVHQKGYTHGDISLKNILYKKHPIRLAKAALADFGMATKITEERYAMTDDQIGYHSIESVAEEMNSLAKVITELKEGKAIADQLWSFRVKSYNRVPELIDGNMDLFFIDWIVHICLMSKHEQNDVAATTLWGNAVLEVQRLWHLRR